MLLLTEDYQPQRRRRREKSARLGVATLAAPESHVVEANAADAQVSLVRSGVAVRIVFDADADARGSVPTPQRLPRRRSALQLRFLVQQQRNVSLAL